MTLMPCIVWHDECGMIHVCVFLHKTNGWWMKYFMSQESEMTFTYYIPFRHFRGKWSDNFRPFLPFVGIKMFRLIISTKKWTMTTATIKSFSQCFHINCQWIWILRKNMKSTLVQKLPGKIHSTIWCRNQTNETGFDIKEEVASHMCA